MFRSPGNYRPAEYWLMAGLAADNVGEQVPLLALKAHHLKLLDRSEVGGLLLSGLPSKFAEHLLGDHRDLPGAMRHQEDDEEQEYAEHRAGKAL